MMEIKFFLQTFTIVEVIIVDIPVQVSLYTYVNTSLRHVPKGRGKTF